MRKRYFISLILVIVGLVIHLFSKSKKLTMEDEINERLAGRM